jgi:4-amino-4-deoxy-L-arabinose transferase-like glycosyltransferase
MLDTGEWVVPYVGGEPYLRKPPLVNWMIAGSIRLCGVRNEWSARLPSVLCVLALGLTIAGVCTPWLGARTATAAALFAIANVAMIDKGRLAEIEGVYVSLAGIAMVLWMAWALQERSAWLLWTVPAAFLGLAALAKGPVHLLFFYSVVLATSRGRREFFSIPHLIGVLLMVAIFAAWAVPYFHATAALRAAGEKANAAGVWQEQMAERFGGGSFVWRDWLLALPRGLSNFLPWVIFVPMWWKKESPEPWFRALRIVVALEYIAFLLIPGFLPRYTMPLLIPASLLLAVAMRAPQTPPSRRERDANAAGTAGRGRVPWWQDGFRVAIGGCSLAVVAMLAFAAVVVPRMRNSEDIRPLGLAINGALPPGEVLYVFDPNYQPALFYVRPPLRYENDVARLPSEVPWLLCREKATDKFRKRWTQVDVRQEFKDKQGNKLRLISLSGRKEA